MVHGPGFLVLLADEARVFGVPCFHPSGSHPGARQQLNVPLAHRHRPLDRWDLQTDELNLLEQPVK